MPHPNSIATVATCRSWGAVVVAAVGLLFPAAAQVQQVPAKAEPDLSVVPEAEALRPVPAPAWSDASVIIFDTAPTFRGGGTTKLIAFIQQQMHRPEAASDLPVGRIFASFWIDVTGQVRNARIVNGLHPLLDAEVLRVISELTGFTPAKQGAKPIAVEMTVPIEFKIR